MSTNFNKRLWLSVGIIAVSIGLTIGGILYVSNDLNANAAKLIHARATMQENTEALTLLATLEQAQPLAQAYETAINSLLPSKTQLINTPQTIARIGQSDGVVATFSCQGNPTTPPAGTVGTVPFSITAAGSLANIASFMKDLETNSAFLLNINSFDVVTNAGNSTLNAQGALYFQ
jgi:Tfp pilus assembly protein PilO